MSNRYNKTLAGPLTHAGAGWVPGADPGAPRIIRIEDTGLDPLSIDGVWQPVASSGRDSVSAEDRARGLWWRLAPAFVVILAASTAAVLLWAVASWYWDLGHAPYHLEKMLLWLGLAAVLGVRAWDRESARDWKHTHSGVEMHRIDRAAEVRIAESRAKLTLQREALQLSLKLLEDRNHDDTTG